MTEPVRSVPRPFEDLTDDRTAEQRQIDAENTRIQVDQLNRLKSGGDAQDELLRKLQERRTTAIEPDVRFELTAGDQPDLVAPTEIVLRLDPGQDIDLAMQILRDANFDPAGAARRASGLRSFSRRAEPPDLVALLQAVRTLSEAGFAAAPSPVFVLHPVVKATASPTPSGLTVKPSGHPGTGPFVVAVIDTGITDQPRTDQWLDEIRRIPVDVGTSIHNVDPLDMFGGPNGPNGLLDFAAGHGTFASGIVRQVDPEAEIRCYLALDSDGFGSEVGVADAMIRAVEAGAHVVNLSLGMRTVDDQPPLALETALDLIDEICENREPPVLVASAGNYGDTRPVWPAASRRVISVAALARPDPQSPAVTTAEWSSRGVWVDCSTIGQGVLSTYVAGTEDPVLEENPETYLADPWAVWSGTSFAAPQIAGAISRLCRELGLPPRVAARRLIRSGSPIPDFGRGLQILPGS